MSIKRKSSLNPGRVQSMKFPGLRESSRKEPGCCIVKRVIVKFFEGIHNQLKKCNHRYYVKIYIVTCIYLCLSIYLSIYICSTTWIFIGRTDAEAEAPIFWPSDAKSWLTGRDSDAWKAWGQKEKRATEEEMVGWHHEFEQTPGDSEGQGNLVCCCSYSHKKPGTTWQVNNNNSKIGLILGS